jgi:perosamine synthetase
VYKEIVDFIKELYNNREHVPLHESLFIGNEKKYLEECIDTHIVSSVGKFVDTFEKSLSKYTGAKRAVAVVNGTSALHLSLLLAEVGKNDEVITQPVSFVATANAIHYTGAHLIFVDIDSETLGMSPEALRAFLRNNSVIRDNKCYNLHSGRPIKACVPVHTFGMVGKVDELVAICEEYKILLIEDAAESIGSTYKGLHAGRFGKMGIISFNGNKIITSGGGGAIITDDEHLANRAKHLSTQAKKAHQWEYYHDQIGYNYRMPNVNAAIGLAQLEKIELILKAKRALAGKYELFFKSLGITYLNDPENCVSNKWLNTILLQNREERDRFLEYANNNGIGARPLWSLLHKLPMFVEATRTDLKTSEWLEDHAICLPGGLHF